jgi:hypothetical protein
MAMRCYIGPDQSSLRWPGRNARGLTAAFGPELKKLEVSRTSVVTARPDLSSHRFLTAACDPKRTCRARTGTVLGKISQRIAMHAVLHSALISTADVLMLMRLPSPTPAVGTFWRSSRARRE